MSENTITVTDYRRGHGKPSTYLRPAAWKALCASIEITRKAQTGCEPWTDGDQAHYDRVMAAANTDPITAQLLPTATRMAQQGADEYDIAVALVNEQNSIDPLPPRVPFTYDDENDRCRHGRTFTEDCPDCEI